MDRKNPDIDTQAIFEQARAGVPAAQGEIVRLIQGLSRAACARGGLATSDISPGLRSDAIAPFVPVCLRTAGSADVGTHRANGEACGKSGRCYAAVGLCSGVHSVVTGRSQWGWPADSQEIDGQEG